MNPLELLRKKRQDAIDAIAVIESTATEGARAFTPDERSTMDKHIAEIETFDADIKRAEKAEQMRGTAPAKPAQAPLVVKPTPGVEVGEDHRSKEPWKHPGEFFVAVRGAGENGRASQDYRLNRSDLTHLSVRAAAGMNEGTSADGGYMIDPQISNDLWKETFDASQLWSKATNFPIGPNATSIKFKQIAETSRATGSRWGGIQAYWVGEAEAITSSKLATRVNEVTIRKLGCLTYATDELLDDWVALFGLIKVAFPDEMSFMLDDAVINGTGGSTQPIGILDNEATGTISVAKETNQTAATINMANVEKMKLRMHPRRFQNAVWLVNPDAEVQLRRMVIPITNVAGTENVGGQLIYMPPGGFSGAPYGTLFNRPVIPIESTAALGTVGDIILADLSQYVTVSKGPMQSAQSIHVKFDTVETAFRFVIRVGGKPRLMTAITQKNSSNTIGHFVTLATRA